LFPDTFSNSSCAAFYPLVFPILWIFSAYSLVNSTFVDLLLASKASTVTLLDLFPTKADLNLWLFITWCAVPAAAAAVYSA
jgi:hypothetical protein